MRYSFFILLILPVFLFADKQSNADSLKHLLPGSKEKEKLELLQNLTRQYLFLSSDSCMKYGTLALNLAMQLQDREQEALASKRLGYSFYRTGDYDQSINYYERALENFLETKQYLDAAIITNFLGDVYSQKSDYVKAIHYYIETEKNCDTLIGKYSIQTSLKRLYAILYTNLGLLYYRLDSVQKPFVYFNKALRFADEINDSNRIAASYSNLGMMYKTMNDYDLALKNYFKSLKISQKIGNRDYEKATLNNIATLYKKRRLNDSALVYYRKAIEIANRTGDKYGLSLINRNMAELYLTKGDFQHAFELAFLAQKYAREAGSLSEVYSDNKLLSEVYQAKGDYKNAFQYYLKYIALKDSVMSAETRERIAEIQTKYETEKKEQENRLLKKDIEIEKRKSYYLIIMVTFLIIIGFIGLALFYFIRKNISNKRKLAELETARLEEKVAHQKRELTSSTLSLSRNLEFINSLINDITQLTEHVDNDKAYASINRIIKKLEQQNSDKCWEEFETRFKKIHHNFYKKLHDNFTGLTPNDLKLCALLKLGMNTKEICSVTFQSVRAVEAARLRLRKKLKLTVGENLSVFLQKI
ncbi:MAG: tetratricopeptide repeat protein [Chlorobi bacterium]|nr:tetratricopeptide repeat protein [Chlorobiota bacterium]